MSRPILAARPSCPHPVAARTKTRNQHATWWLVLVLKAAVATARSATDWRAAAAMMLLAAGGLAACLAMLAVVWMTQ